MLLKYKQKANFAAAVWLVSLAVLLVLMPETEANIWDTGDGLRMALMILSIGSFWLAFWAYAKAKGRSGLWGLILPFFSVFGLIVLASLKDKHPEGVTKNNDSFRIRK